jgi:hypothetical protein
MKSSKRPTPMVFGAADDPQREPDAEPAAVELGIRPAEVAPSAQWPATQGEQLPARPLEDPAQPVAETVDSPASGWPVWIVASGVALLWALAPIAFALGYRAKVSPLQDDQFALAIFALLAIGPAFLVFGCAYFVRQAQKLAGSVRRAEANASSMLSPALIAAARAGQVSQGVREEISRTGEAADAARDALLALRDALALETAKLVEATDQSVRTAHELAGALGRERGELSDLSKVLDAEAVRVTDAVGRQARMVAEAAGVAESQVREAESILSGRAADLVAAAGEASGAARTASEDLTRHIARLEAAGAGVSEEVRSVESGLTQQRAALVTLMDALRADHEQFSAKAEAHAATFHDFLQQAQRSAAELGQQSTAGGDALRQLMEDAATRLGDLTKAVQGEREAFRQSTQLTLDAVAAAAVDQRRQMESQALAVVEALEAAAEETRAAALRHATIAREQVDHLSEAAFNAGQKANQVFEARLEEAQVLVEQSSKMIEDAGAAAARKLEESAADARRAMGEITELLGEIEERTARLPTVAQAQADQVRAAVAHGIGDLMEQARRTTAQAEAIDADFQERVRRNFEMLSEAVRFMGVAAVAPTPARTLERRAVEASPPEPEPEALMSPPPEDVAPGAELADRIGLRNRIRLAPTATDQEFSAIFEAASGAPPPGGDAAEETGEPWTWKDLLASLDDDGEGTRLEVLLEAELKRLGMDPEKLVPAAGVRQIAITLQAGDAKGGREIVRKLAPAAIRRLSRRLLTDQDVGRKGEIFVRRHMTLVNDTVARDPAGDQLVELLSTKAGRMFLLLDAAGDGA